MKVLLYTENEKMIAKSGLGKAIKHQIKALEDNNIDYTLDIRDDYDIVHINFYGPKSYDLAKNAHKLGKKVVYHAHSTEEDFKNGFIFSKQLSPIFKKWIMKCYNLGDVIITPTEYSKRILEGYGLNKKIYSISNGVDTKFFKKDEKLGREFRKKYGYTKDDKVIIGIGLYIERKGIVDFVKLASQMKDYKFIWFGYSPKSMATKEVKKALEMKLDNLTFAGYVESKMIKAAMSGCDLYIFPTYEETEGMPLIEAFASSCNTIVRDIPVFSEYEEGKIVYKAKNNREFKRKIEAIIEGKLPSLTKNALEVAKEKDLLVVGRKLKEVYNSLLVD